MAADGRPDGAVAEPLPELVMKAADPVEAHGELELDRFRHAAVDIDRWLTRTGHPLAWEPGRPEDRFRALVRAELGRRYSDAS
ncbi:MAG: hypothetical protein M3024_01445 [Candidatus Dormibacteraeota bacterium]|nr:hypothetical protein [Candidatus Dormibacteraeota bacterium]